MTHSDPLLDALRDHFRYDAFRPQQREVIEHIEAGGDALVLMPTGGGKSLCYQLPAMCSDGLTVVVSPLIALMQDQVDALRQRGARAAHLNSTLSPIEMNAVERGVADGSLNLLYVSPERVNTDRFRSLLERRPPRLIAIDEAHCISQWGHEFRPDYRVLRYLTDRFLDVPTIACTATATPQVQRDIIEQLDRPRMRTFATGFGRDNLAIRIVPKKKAVERLAARLRETPGQSAIVYSQSRKSTEETAESLRRAGIAAERYHAGVDSQDRAAVQGRFLSGETPVICATIAFGMGIDKPDVRLVAHLDMPASIEQYYQEIGRAGRDGQPAECLLFYTKGVWHTQQFFIRQIKDEDERRQRTNRLRTMMSFSEQSSCRWARILQYFGEQPATDHCGHCDNCLGEAVAESKAEQPLLVDQSDPPPPPGQPTVVGGSSAGDGQALFDRMSALRRRLSTAEDIPAFMVASNKALWALVEHRPRTKQEMLSVPGWGPAKVNKYGDDLITLIDEPERQEVEPDVTANDDAPPEDWQQRFNALSAWRGMMADEEGCEASDLLTYPAMRELAEHPPATIAAFASVEGVGSLALEKYANDLAAILGIGAQAESEPRPPVPPTDRAQQSWEVTLDLYDDGHSILAVAERRMLSPSTVVSHLITSLRHGRATDLKRSLPPSDAVEAVRREIMRDPDASGSVIHERLNQRLSRPEIALTVAYIRPPEPVDD